MQSEMLGARSAQQGSRDVEAETAALSLARRRGKCAPSVDTKLADAWLGFYVALTKSSLRPTEAATQASTEAVTECSSDVASSGGLSPRRAVSEPLTCGTLCESWADASEELSPSPKKRSRRSHRRRRTRGRGKKGRSSGVGDSPEDDCAPIDEEEDGLATPCGSPVAMAASPGCTQLAHSGVVSTCLSTPTTATPLQSAQVVLPSECVAMSSPSKAFKCPMGRLTGTSPNAVLTPSHCEASARTPPRVAFGSSPVANMLPPSTPTSFGSLTSIYQGGHATFQGSHMMLAYPGSAFAGSPCHVQPEQAPTFFVPALSPPPAHSPRLPDLCSAPMSADVMAMRSWLAGGLPTNDEDLAMHLWAALPQAYED